MVKMRKLSSVEIALLAATFIAVIVAGVAIYYATVRIRNTGRIRSIGVSFYLTPALQQKIELIEWGDVNQGAVYGITLHCFNDKNTAVTLEMSLENWVPSGVEAVLSVSWDYDGRTLMSGEAMAIGFQLGVAVDAQGFESFSFDIVVTATSLGDLV